MPLVTLVSHEAFDRNTRRGPGRVHSFQTADGLKLETWNSDLANQAFALMNLPANVEYTSKQNGQYTNHTLTSIAAANGAQAAPAGAGASAPVVQSTPTPAPAPTPDLKDQRIARAHGTNAALEALNIAGGDRDAAEQLLKDAISLAHYAAAYSFAGPTKKSSPAPEPSDSPQAAQDSLPEPTV